VTAPGRRRVSSSVQIIPAIDISAGRLARSAGATDPVTEAAAAVSAGAEWVHVVDMDRAFGRGRPGDAAIRRIAATVRVQLGGGLTQPGDVAEALGWGVARVVLGAGALEDAAALEALVSRHGAARIVVALDVRDGRVVGRPLGGVAPAVDFDIADARQRAGAAGITTVVYRDLARDGTLAGADWDAVATLAGDGVDVVVAGGIASLDEIRRARARGVHGVIVGRALLEGRFTLEEALACSR